MAPKLHFNQSLVTFDLWCITYDHWSRGICHPKHAKSLDIAPNITSQHTLCMGYTGWPKKNATILIRYFNEILDWIPFIFCCIGYNILFQVIWYQVHQVWIRRFDSRAIFLRQCHFQNVLLFPRKQAWNSWNLFHLTASHWMLTKA